MNADPTQASIAAPNLARMPMPRPLTAPLPKALAGSLLCALAGCAWINDDRGFIRNTSDDYLDARERRPLVIPQDMETSPIRDTYDIPAIAPKPLARHFPKRAPRPDAIFADTSDDAVKIQRLAGRSWLVVGDPPATAWPVVKQFFGDNGVAVAAESPTGGRVDGDWLTVGDEDYRDVVRDVLKDVRNDAGVSSGKDRVRFLIEHGIRPGSSEIHIRHENDALATPTEAWPAVSALPDVEEQLLHEFGGYYGADVTTQSISMIALDIASREKAVVERDDEGYPLLRLNVDFERAWAVVGQALQRAPVSVKDLERSTGSFQVEIDPRELGGDRPGFFSRFIPGRGGGRTQSFDVRIVSAGDSQVVQVFEPGGDPAPQDLSQQLLVMLREFAA